MVTEMTTIHGMETTVINQVTKTRTDTIRIVTEEAKTVVVPGVMELKISHAITMAVAAKSDTTIDLINHRGMRVIANIISKITVTKILMNHRSCD